MAADVLVYGAYGYTGLLIVDEALRAGLRPVVAGRDPARVAETAAGAGLEARVFGLDDPASLDAGLSGCRVVIHAAGPFSRTARQMADACLRTGAHYLDITGEVAVFEELAGMNLAAAEAGVMLMPGAGFDVVPSDCLAVRLKELLPTATGLSLAFHSQGRPSHGTQATIVENLGRGGLVRRQGELLAVPHAWKERDIDFGETVKTCVTIPWGDVSTAYRSTGIPNIEVYMSAPPAMRSGMRLARPFTRLLGAGPVQRLLQRRIPPGGPAPDERARGYCLLWGEALDDAGNRAEARLRTANGYTLTAATAVGIARKVLDGQATPGFQTPAKMYGPDLILEAPGSRYF